MKSGALLVLACTATTVAAAPRRELSAADVQARLRPLADDVQRCYVQAAAATRGAGHLRLVFDIDRHGGVDDFRVETPALSSKQRGRIEDCARAVVANVTFPASNGRTIATVPYYFQQTKAPGAGPVESCWNPKGCADR